VLLSFVNISTKKKKRKPFYQGKAGRAVKASGKKVFTTKKSIK